MDLYKLVNELKRGAAAIESVLTHPDKPQLQPGDIAQVRLDGHPNHGGRLVIVNRELSGKLRVTLLTANRGGSWGTDVELMPAQLNYIGTPRLADAPQRYDCHAHGRATILDTVRQQSAAIAFLSAPGGGTDTTRPPKSQSRKSRKRPE